MTDDRLTEARALIRAGQYDRARVLLHDLATPEARHLLAGLEVAAPTARQRLMHSRAWFWAALGVALGVFVVAAGVLVYVLSRPAPERFDVPFGGATVTTERSYEGEVDIVVRGTGNLRDGHQCDAYYLFADAQGQPLEPPEPFACLLVNGMPGAAFWRAQRDYDPDHAYRITYRVLDGPLTFSAPDLSAGDDGHSFAVEVHPR